MTSESKTWQRLKDEYLHQVERALSSVHHPGARDVLDDVSTHLERRLGELAPAQQTAENLRAIIAEMGPPADYAELLESEGPVVRSGARVRPTRWIALAGAAVVVVVAIAIIVVLRGGPGPSDKMAAEELAARAWNLWRQRQFSEAETLFAQAVEKDATNANAWNGLGWAQFNQGKSVTAASSFGKCLDIKATHPAALNGLGWIAKSDNKIDEAIDYWQRAVEAAPSATAALNGLATTYMETQQYDKAVEIYEKWLRVEPTNAQAKAGLEQARQQLTGGASQDEAIISAAVDAARSWLQLVDNGSYSQAWIQGAPVFKQRVAEQQFQSSLETARSPLGKVLSREVLKTTYTTSLPGASDGQYVIVQFRSAFEHKASAVETVTPALDDDGQWRVSGYFIK